MIYDFDAIIERRRTDCEKWDHAPVLFGAPDVLPLWVADMDFPVAEPIIKAIRERADHPVYGYTFPGESLKAAICERFQRLYDWSVRPEWLVYTPGVVPALAFAIKAITDPGDAVVIMSPVYPPFTTVVVANGCEVLATPLELRGDRYEVDFDALEANLANPKTKALILCSPHNPGGRVWTRDELERITAAACRHGRYILSDEIHGELLLNGNKHIPVSVLSEEAARRSIIFTAPTKTFNLAGLTSSIAVIEDEELRKRFARSMAWFVGFPNLFGLAAMEAAYRDGDEWLSQVLGYIEGNLDFLTEFFAARIPRIKVMKPEATYLVWLDCRDLGMEPAALARFFSETAKVGLNAGHTFGSGGEGFMRINIACPRAILQEALERIEKAVATQPD